MAESKVKANPDYLRLLLTIIPKVIKADRCLR